MNETLVFTLSIALACALAVLAMANYVLPTFHTLATLGVR